MGRTKQARPCHTRRPFRQRSSSICPPSAATQGSPALTWRVCIPIRGKTRRLRRPLSRHCHMADTIPGVDEAVSITFHLTEKRRYRCIGTDLNPSGGHDHAGDTVPDPDRQGTAASYPTHRRQAIANRTDNRQHRPDMPSFTEGSKPQCSDGGQWRGS